MRDALERGTGLALLVAALLAIGAGLAMGHLPETGVLAIGAALAVLLAAAASNELALHLLLAAMLLGPEVVLADMGPAAALGRGVTLRLDDLLLAVIALHWLARTAADKELGLVLRTPLNWPIAAFAVTTAVATGLAMIEGHVEVAGGALFVLKYVQYFVIYVMVVNNLRERAQFVRLLVSLFATAVITSLFAIAQIPTGERVVAPFEGYPGEPNTLGGYLVVVLALAMGLALTSPSRARAVRFAILALMFVVPLGFTLSRGSYVALIAAAGGLVVWSPRRRPVLAIAAVAVLVLPLVIPDVIVDRILFTISQPSHPDQVDVGVARIDTSVSDRLHAWRVVFEDWPRRPLFGFGVTGYRFIDAQYPRVLAESGLLGLASFVWLQWAMVRHGAAVLRSARDPLFRGVSLGFLSGLVGLIAHSLGANTFMIVRIMEPFWFVCGMVMMIPRLEAGSDPVPVRAPRAPASGSVPC